jgi:predicted nucleic acid-binding Zn ribbon protein
MDSERRQEFSKAWQRWCSACEKEWKDYREGREGRPAKSLSQLVQKELTALGLTERMMEDQLVSIWEEVVGPANAFHTRPIQLKKGELTVAVSQPALKYDLERFHMAEILRRLQEKMGKGMVRVIRFRVGN